MNKYYVGIDTSAYTTSLAVIDEKDNIVLDLRNVLKVRKGQKGLRQQEAVFQHMNNLPILIEKMIDEIDISQIKIISCSNKPRNIEGSYMPVFVVGKGQAFVLSKVLGVKYKEFSHQEGHIGAGILYSNLKEHERFICLHISGGTTELLLVNNQEDKFKIDIIGGTLDLSAGQLIDRIGVEVGLGFPCGGIMDKLSERGKILDLNIPLNIKDKTWVNLSGMENYFKNLMKIKSYKIEDIFSTLFYTIASFMNKIIINSCIEYKIDGVLLTGGVSANRIIREYLKNKLNKENIITFSPERELCTDNGIGIAYIGKEK